MRQGLYLDTDCISTRTVSGDGLYLETGCHSKWTVEQNSAPRYSGKFVIQCWILVYRWSKFLVVVLEWMPKSPLSQVAFLRADSISTRTVSRHWPAQCICRALPPMHMKKDVIRPILPYPHLTGETCDRTRDAIVCHVLPWNGRKLYTILPYN